MLHSYKAYAASDSSSQLFGDKEDVMMHIDDIKTRGHTNEKAVPVY
jgi:hypothetical protein